MSVLKKIARNIPFLRSLYGRLRNRYIRVQPTTTEQVFTKIYTSNKWGGMDSVSGTGSDLDQTGVIRREIPTLLRKHGVATMLDIPCGDFHWMSATELGNVRYVGADIVTTLIDTNRDRYSDTGVEFRQMDLIKDNLPRVDVVFCRDCLVHLSFDDAFSALRNICRSESRYLLTTTFKDRNENVDIATGRWRPLNLRAAPFNFPEPLDMIIEECTEGGGMYKDKALGLWEISEIRRAIKAQ